MRNRFEVATILALACWVWTGDSFQTQPLLRPTPGTRRMPTIVTKTSPPSATPLISRARPASSTSLSALSLPFSSSPLGAVSVLCFIVLVHEAGHYLAARYFGIDVEEFSVGVGPKLFGFEAFGNDFSLRALPLGGYVRFPENYNATLVNEMRAQAVQDAKAKLESSKKGGIGTRLLNAISLGAVDRKQKEEEDSALAEKEKLPFWKRLGDDNLDVPEIDIPYDDNPNLLQNRPWQERAVVLSSGVIFNILLSFSIYFGQITGGAGIPSPVFEPGVLVTSSPRPSAASEGILRKGDVILDINGRPLTQSASPSMFESQGAINDCIAQIRSTPAGNDIKLTVLHENKKTEVVSIKPKPLSGGTVGSPSIGVLLSPNYVKSAILQSKNPIQAAELAAQYTVSLTRETANGLLTAFGSLFKSNGSSGVQLSGPIGLIRTGSSVVSTQDVAAIALFAAALSINLGVVNALPLPALDGGQLLFVIAEALTGRKVDQRIQEGITGVAVLFLLLVTLGAAVGDVSSIVVGR